MPNLNVKGDAPKSSGSPASSGGGGGLPKTALIIVISIVALGAVAFILNTTGIVKLWGKKKPAPQVVSIPTESYQPVTQDTAQTMAEVVPTPENMVPAPEENLTKVETTAQPKSKQRARKDIVRGTGMYSVQISSWPVVEKANAQAQVFTDAGFDAFIEPMGNYYRVCVGRFETKADAKTQMEKMEHMLESRPVVVKVGK
jgi:cell division septation protein DedD